MVLTKTTPSQREQAGHQRIRLALLDDHVLLRESLARPLASEQDFDLLVAKPASAPKVSWFGLPWSV
jgi:hypothetical protein